jgi:alpha-L-rhamnosidase
MKTSLLILAAMLLAPLAAVHAAEVSAPAGLTTDSLVNPAVTEDLTPRLSWKLPWTNRGAAQSAYQVLAASSAEKLAAGKADLWDSGEVKSTSSVLVGYAGKPLAAAQTVWWKVRVADEKSDWSQWSEPAFFTTAKPWPESWSARWITYPDTAFSDDKLFKMMERRLNGKPPYYPEAWRVPRGDFVDRYVEDASFGIYEIWPKQISKEQALDYTKDRLDEVPPSPMFRRDFELPDGVKRATLHAAGLGWQEVFINGKRVGEGVNNPAPTEYRKIGLYEAFDVTHLLRKGGNAIGVHVGGGWYQQGVAWSGDFIYGRPGVLLELEYELGDGTKGKVVSDSGWQASLAGPVVKDNFYGGCLYDARREMPGWSEPGFPAEGWVPVTPAALPLVPALEPAALPPVKVTEVVRDDAMKEVAPGVWQMDARYVTGYVRLQGIDAPAGTVVSIAYSDSLDADGRVNASDSGADAAGVRKLDRYVCKGTGRESFEPKFVFRGFRYAEISGLPPGVKPDAEAVNLATDVRRNGRFACSDAILNDYHDMVVRTLGTHMHGIVTDNNTRERNQWGGDCMMTAETFSWLYDMLPFWRKIARDMQTSTCSQEAAGKTWPDIPRAVTANMRGAGFSALWSAAIIRMPWTAYVYYGDTDILRENYPWMQALMNYCEAISKDGLLSTYHWGDHLETSVQPHPLRLNDPDWKPFETPPGLVNNGHYYDWTRAMARIAGIIGRGDDAARYTSLAERIREAFIGKYYDARNRTYGSQSADGMALAFGLYPEGDREALAASLAGHVRARGGHVNVGTINAPSLYRALSETGQGDLLFAMFAKQDYPGVGFMRKMGSKTIWESYGYGIVRSDAKGEGRILSNQLPVSQQALASFGDVLFYRAAGGIRPDPEHPGFKHFFFDVDPAFTARMTFAKVEYESPYGRIESAWKKENGKLVWNVTVPPNTTATASIPASSAESVTESGKSLAKAEGVKFTKIENGRALCELQAGTYRFESKLEEKKQR